MNKLLWFAATLFLALGIPLVGSAEPAGGKKGTKTVSGIENKVDLNHATFGQLCTLPGIGPKKARAIMAHRKKRPFSRITQLVRVKGIGPRTLARLKGRITVHGKKPPKKGPGERQN
jgi:competence protein ComEA